MKREQMLDAMTHAVNDVWRRYSGSNLSIDNMNEIFNNLDDILSDSSSKKREDCTLIDKTLHHKELPEGYKLIVDDSFKNKERCCKWVYKDGSEQTEWMGFSKTISNAISHRDFLMKEGLYVDAQEQIEAEFPDDPPPAELPPGYALIAKHGSYGTPLYKWRHKSGLRQAKWSSREGAIYDAKYHYAQEQGWDGK